SFFGVRFVDVSAVGGDGAEGEADFVGGLADALDVVDLTAGELANGCTGVVDADFGDVLIPRVELGAAEGFAVEDELENVLFPGREELVEAVGADADSHDGIESDFTTDYTDDTEEIDFKFQI